MARIQLYAMIASVLSAVSISSSPAQASGHWSIGLRFGFPVYPFGPCCYPSYPYRAVYVTPAPVLVPAPVAVAAVPPSHPAYQAASTPPPPELAPQSRQVAEPLLAQLASPDEHHRLETALQLGRLKSPQTVDPLAATLAGDRSPAVREAAARALAMIGSPQALPALEKAAGTDPDHDVRHSARFAIDVINSGR